MDAHCLQIGFTTVTIKSSLKSIVLILFVFLTLSGQHLCADTTQTFAVPEGNTVALIDAIEQANLAPGGTTTLLELSGTYALSNNQGLPKVTGSVVLSGFSNGHTRIQGTGKTDDNDQIINVAEGGRLVVRYIDFMDFSLAGGRTEKLPLIENEGSLDFEAVHFEDIKALVIHPAITGLIYNEMLFNRGDLSMDGVSMLNVGAYGDVGDGVILSNEGSATLKNVLMVHDRDSLGPANIANVGDLRLINVTFTGQPTDLRYEPVVTRPPGRTQVVNSIFGLDYGGRWCGDAESLGHNLVQSSDCAFDSEGDVVTYDIGLTGIQRAAVPWHGEEPSHVVQALSSTSLAVGTADPTWCPPTDLLQQSRLDDGDGDGQVTCDRGAVEFTGTTLDSGGATGWYYDPEKNGHYVFVLDNVYNVLVGWNTFDRFGNQAWIYATGSLVDGKSFEADAYVNLDGKLTPQGPIDINRAVPWGRIRLEFSSCRDARFSFWSTDPSFGNGDFNLTRLAYSRQLVCFD